MTMDETISIKFEDESLADAIWELSKHIDIPISYSPKDIQKKKINEIYESKSISYVLDDILEGTNNYFNYSKNQLYILRSFLDNLTLSGYIQDANSGERLIGASISSQPSHYGTAANNFGFFSLKGDVRDTSAIITYIGYEPFEIDFRNIDDNSLIIEMSPDNDLPEITIKATELNQVKPELKSNKDLIEVYDLTTVSSVGGEQDIMRLIYQLPGATTGADGLGGLHVRGGNADQNLIMLDGVQIYNPYHSFGLFSIFDYNTISSVKYLKGAFPSRFGGRISSVLDIRLKDGNNKKFASKVSVGLLTTKAMVEGPIIKDKMSFMVNARRTHFNSIFKNDNWRKKLVGEGAKELGYQFGDIVSKLTYTPTSKDRIYLSFYGGNDSFKKSTTEIDTFIYDTQENSDQILDWGNKLIVSRWNHQFSKNLFSNLTINYSKFKFVSEDVEEYINEEYLESPADTFLFSSKYNSNIKKQSVKLEFEYIPNSKHYLRSGITYAHNKYTPGVSESNSDIDSPINNESLNSREINFYIEDDWQISKVLTANIGAFSSIFKTENNAYYSLEPRISMVWKPVEKLTLGTSFSKVSQNLHVLSREGAGFPTDLWVPSTDIVKPQSAIISDFSVDYVIQNFAEVSISSFYKKMNNIISYRESLEFGSSNNLLTSDNWQQKATQGEGTIKGLEFQIRRNASKYSVVAGYSYTDSSRKFDLVNNGKEYPFTFEHRHNINLNFSRELSQKWRVDFSWNYKSGSFINIPLGKWQYIRENGIQDFFFYDIGEKNSFQLPSYHRLDFALTYQKPISFGEFKFVFGVYNLYNRRNSYSINAEFVARSNELTYNNVSIIPILPYFLIEYSIF